MTQPASSNQLPLGSLKGDGTAILLSGLCVVHCLALPVILSLLPWLAWMHEHEPLIHRLLLLMIVPLSISVLLRGRAKHMQRSALWLGVAALACLLSAVLIAGLPHELEITLTTVGSVALIGSHLLNMRNLKRVYPQGSIHGETPIRA